MIPARDLVFFVATRADDVPATALRFASVDGSVPGAIVTWDHHVTGELVNLDAMPARYDASSLDAVGTTLADTDAVASCVAVAVGGKSELPRDVLDALLAASHWCDHLGPHPALDEATNTRGGALNRWVSNVLRAASKQSEGLARASRELLARIIAGDELPGAEPDTTQEAHAHALSADGRIRAIAGVALVDLRGASPIDPAAVYALHREPVAVTFMEHGKGGLKYTVGVNPFVPHPADLGAALARLAELEHGHGPPALLARPGPGSENWGGRATVFGSPWNYGSRLAPEEVARTVGLALGLAAPAI